MMKKPAPIQTDVLGIVRPDTNEAQIEAILIALSAAQLTALLKRVEDLRAEKLHDAKRELIAEYRAKAAELGLTFEDIVKPSSPTKTTKPPRASTPTPPMPHDWEARVIQYLEANDGRAHANMLHRIVWPGGNTSSGSGGKLRGHLMDLVKRDILLLLRPGGPDGRALYGLASMIEDPGEEEAAE